MIHTLKNFNPVDYDFYDYYYAKSKSNFPNNLVEILRYRAINQPNGGGLGASDAPPSAQPRNWGRGEHDSWDSSSGC